MPLRRTRLVLLGVAWLLAACQGYDVTVNDRVVYSPAPLFAGFDIPDPGLATCVRQAVIDQAITDPSDLKDLNCAHAGIESLDGLAEFSGLTRLGLASNRVRNLVELGRLGELEALYLEDNRVVDPVPLYGLRKLQILDLSGNATLQCPARGMLDRVDSLALPEHCTGA